MKMKASLYCFLIVLGVILVGAGGFVLNEAKMRTVSGVMIGVGAGLIGLSIAQLVIIGVLRKNPEYSRKVMIEEHDERNTSIRSLAKGKAFDAMGTIYTITMLVCVLINADLSVILLLVTAYLLVYGIYFYYLSKLSREM